ncbi:uncharacterized protein [Temnothorax longispinosus]|uniref:uncharacterized protein isoform X4 n=1 Tax=Temnothorax longispinosus TaxID=300112 RepID=UPI003A990DE6
MNIEMERYYAVNKFFLFLLGGWPYQRKVIKILIPCLVTIVLYSTIVTQVMHRINYVLLIYDTWGDLDIAVECIIIIIVVLGSNIKLINIVINNDKFRRLLQLMNKHWELFNSEFESHILRYNAGISQKVANYFAVYLNATLIFNLLIPFTPKILDIVIPLNESRPLAYVYQAEHRVDKEKYYYPIVFHSYITCIIVVVIVFTVDTTYLKCVLHACSLFTAIRHAQTLDSMFTQATLILLSLNMVILSVMGIQFINNLTQEKIIQYVFVTYGVFIHLIYMCIPGQLLIDRSGEVFDKAYSSEWYTFSIKSRKLLRVLLYRSLAPCTLTAGKMFVMSTTMCSSVMRTAMSYFTAFLSIR